MIVFFPGSFDPPTFAHFDIIARIAKIATKVYVGVGHNPEKKSWLSPQERVHLIEQQCHLDTKVSVLSFTGLSTVQAQSLNASVILRGFRNHTDLDYEQQRAIANKHLNPHIETIYLNCDPKLSGISSSLTKEIWTLGGDASWCVPKEVLEFLTKKQKGNKT